MNWQIGKIKLTGTSHKADNTPCQDFYLSELIPTPNGPILVALVADGAGSATHSHLGSNKGCEALYMAVLNWINGRDDNAYSITEELIREWILQAHTEVIAVAEGYKIDSRQFASTLVGCVIQDNLAHFFQIGDGALVIQNEEGIYEPIFWPDNGEYANTTYFLTDENFLQNTQTSSRSMCVKKVALFSDGLQNLLLVMSSRSAHQPFFNKIFDRLRQEQESVEKFQEEMEQLFSSPMVQSRTDDDISLIVALRQGSC